MHKFFGCLLGSILLLAAGSASADPETCREALDQYRSAKSDVESALAIYRSCVDGGDGHDDCSSEFSSLQSAQDDFESAVSEYENECQ